MKRNKTALLELCRTDEQSVFGKVREFELQSLRDPKASAGDQRQQVAVYVTGRIDPAWSEL